MLDPFSILQELVKPQDRLVSIPNLLKPLPIKQLYFGKGDNFVLIPDNPVKTLILAHWDRVPGSPGANDNGAACSELASAALNKWNPDSNTLIAWVDKEEPANGGMADGSRALRKYLQKNNIHPERVIVFDMDGIGDTLCLSNNYGTLSSTQKWIEEKANEIQLPMAQIVTPPSDNLSFVGSALLTTLPREEVEMKGWRPAWRTIHSENDNLETITPDILVKMANLMEKMI